MTEITGGCHCGTVRYTCSADPLVAGHCQCTDCRRFSGSGHSSHMAVPREAVALTGSARGYDAPAASGNMVTRYFCAECGAPVYSTNSGMTELLFLRASSLDDSSHFQPQMVVWAARAPAWDYVEPGLPSFDWNPPGVGK